MRVALLQYIRNNKNYGLLDEIFSCLGVDSKVYTSLIEFRKEVFNDD